MFKINSLAEVFKEMESRKKKKMEMLLKSVPVQNQSKFHKVTFHHWSFFNFCFTTNVFYWFQISVIRPENKYRSIQSSHFVCSPTNSEH